jgi:hypothetical protein
MTRHSRSLGSGFDRRRFVALFVAVIYGRIGEWAALFIGNGSFTTR